MAQDIPETLIEYSLSQRGAIQDYPFGPMPMVIKIHGRMFALFSKGEPHWSVALKCDPEIATNLREQNASITPGYHLNKKHWISIELDGSIPEPELFAMIDHSYSLVLSKVPKSRRP
jgi:predicted DNA-binding protein (MmcQ/YjbR family)